MNWHHTHRNDTYVGSHPLWLAAVIVLFAPALLSSFPFIISFAWLSYNHYLNWYHPPQMQHSQSNNRIRAQQRAHHIQELHACQRKFEQHLPLQT